MGNMKRLKGLNGFILDLFPSFKVSFVSIKMHVIPLRAKKLLVFVQAHRSANGHHIFKCLKVVFLVFFNVQVEHIC